MMYKLKPTNKSVLYCIKNEIIVKFGVFYFPEIRCFFYVINELNDRKP